MDLGIRLDGLLPGAPHFLLQAPQVQCLCLVGPLEHGDKPECVAEGELRSHHRTLYPQCSLLGGQNPLRIGHQVPLVLRAFDLRAASSIPAK